jgi:hypothetical protein
LHSAVIRDRTCLHQNRLSNGVTLILEIKGFEDDETKAKHNAAKRWVTAVNNCRLLANVISTFAGIRRYRKAEELTRVAIADDGGAT